MLKLQSEIADKMKAAEEAGESGEVDTAQELMDKVEVRRHTHTQRKRSQRRQRDRDHAHEGSVTPRTHGILRHSKGKRLTKDSITDTLAEPRVSVFGAQELQNKLALVLSDIRAKVAGPDVEKAAGTGDTNQRQNPFGGTDLSG